MILDTAYRVHAHIEAKADRRHHLQIQPAPIVKTELRPEAGRPAASRTNETPTGCRVRPEYGCGQFHPQIRTEEKGIAVERYSRTPKIPKSLGSIWKPDRSSGEFIDGTPMAPPTPPTPELRVRVPGHSGYPYK